MTHRTLYFFPSLLLAVATAFSASPNTISLSGAWQVRLDPKIIGLSQNWIAPGATFAETLQLPGTTDEARLGVPLSMRPAVSKEGLSRLQRQHSFIGPVWYRRTIEIPAEWQGKRITLSLERVLWESEVWIDGHEIGKQNSLSTPHVFDLSTFATPGRHELIVRVDNRQLFDIGRSHAYVEDTQSLWNGIVGALELRTSAAVWIESVRINPDPDKAEAEIIIGNASGKSGEGVLRGKLSAPGFTKDIEAPARWDKDGGKVSIALNDQTLPLWSDTAPNLCRLSLTLQTSLGSSEPTELRFGFRKIAALGPTILLNGIPKFLRGTHEGASFPLTGYPPMDVGAWRRIFKILKQWGLNHMRFHSYCPPEACFTAADEEGIYLQAELPLWTGDLDKPGDASRVQWIRDEAARILRAYGNHPSLVLFSLGNELHGKYAFMQQLLGELQKSDPRRLYTSTSNRLWIVDAPEKTGEKDGPHETDDFLVERAIRIDGKIQGMRGQAFFDRQPNTTDDFSNILARTDKPVLTHEIGQWSVFPNLAEIPRYSGVLRALNLEAIREDLQKNDLLGQAKDFTRASGQFAAELYRQEIELALRSKPLAGYQLLDLHDYPGQGTAHVGLLDSFWDSKGIAEADSFREVAAPVVPLVRMPKRVYTSDETFSGTVEFANFSGKPLTGVATKWELLDEDEKIIAQGELPPVDIGKGPCQPAGTISIPLAAATKPLQAKLRLTASKAGAKNSWKIWIVPPQAPAEQEGVVVTTSIDEAKAALEKGGTVLYTPAKESVLRRQDTAFLPAFWSPVYFTNQTGTMGLLIDDKHPALADFPTEDHSDWQWWSILTPSPGAVVLDESGFTARPIVQVIDAFSRNQKLGLIFEAIVGNGRLLVCAADLGTTAPQDPMRRQLRASLIRYLAAPAPPRLPTMPKESLQNLFCEKQSESTATDTWSKDLEPPPAKK
ncbi:MAG: sugar-binding domain-containing protein [Chthoniobacterales bacterium]